MVLFLVWLCINCSTSNAQTANLTAGAVVDPATGLPVNSTSNVLNLGGGLPWSNTVTGQAGGYSGGYTPAYNPSTGNIIFGYNQGTVSQTVAINKALANAGTGIQLSGYQYSWQVQNDLNNGGGNRGSLTGNVSLTGPTGNVLESFNYYYSNLNTGGNFQQFTGTQYFNNRYDTAAATDLTVSFTGKDQNWWAGYYGPRVHVDSLSLLYTTNPCAQNPAYSPTCAGFDKIVTSNNLLNPNLMSNGNIVYNSFAINTALKSSGAGVDVYGFNYGYNYSLGDPTTAGNSTAEVRVRLTDINNNVIYTDGQFRNTPRTAENVSYQFLLPSTTNSLSLGTFTMGASTTGNAAVQNMFANVLYKPDPCVDPLSNPSCPGYATAYAKNLILGSTVAAASAPTAPPALAQATPALAQASPASAPDPTNPAPQQTAQPAQQGPQPQQGPAPAQDPNQNPSAAQDNPAQPSPQQAGPAPTTPQPAGGPPQAATASAPPPSAGPSQPGTQQAGPSGGGSGPSKLAMSVLKTAQANDKATQAAAVQQAAKAFEGGQASSQASSNLAITMNQDMSANSATTAATFASQTTQTSIQTSQQVVQSQQKTQQTNTQSQQTSKFVQQAQTQETQQTQTQTVSSLAQLQPIQQETQQVQNQSTGSVVQIQPNTYTSSQSSQQEMPSTAVALQKPIVTATTETTVQASSGTGLIVSRNPFAYNPLSSLNLSSTSLTVAQPMPAYQPRLQERNTEVEAPQIQVASFGGIGRAGNPLSEIMMQQRFELMQNNIETQTSTVNRNVQPNDLAAGVDLATMAVQPKGFETYSVVLRDAAFYEPKEVYKNQTTVDNVRALRQMSSDSLHKQMVDMQYKIGE